MTRVLLCGAASLVGAEVLRALMARDDVEVGLAESRGSDRLLADLGASPPAVSDGPFDVVINCSDENWIDRLEHNPALRLV